MCCACEARTNALWKKLIKVMDENAKAAHPRKWVCVHVITDLAWSEKKEVMASREKEKENKKLNQWNNVHKNDSTRRKV